MNMQKIILTSGLAMLFVTLGCSSQTATKTQTVRSKAAASAPSSAVPKTTSAPTPNQGATQSAPTLSQICQSDALLLSHFPIKTLYGTPLPKACCAPGVLPPTTGSVNWIGVQRCTVQ